MFEDTPFTMSFVEIGILTGVWITTLANVVFYTKKWRHGDKQWVGMYVTESVKTLMDLKRLVGMHI